MNHAVGSGAAVVVAAATTFVPLAPALAQEELDSIEGIRVFEPGYYTEFDPVTALDMVSRTPGFNLQESSGGRGLSGVRSNLLVNGERPPPKGQSTWQQLGEIPTDRIERLELIDAGARLDLDMQGYPQVLNVVTVADPPAYYEVVTSLRREGTGDNRQDNERHYRVQATSSFFWKQHEFRLRGGADDNGRRSPSGFVAIDPANPEQRVSGLRRSDGTNRNFELDAIIDLPEDSSLSINGQFGREDGSSTPIEFDLSESELNSITETFVREEEDRDIAAEYRRAFGANGTLMVALVDSRSTEQSADSLVANGLQRASLEDSETGETAARLMVTRTPTSQLTVRVTATSAYNFFDGGFRLFENGVERAVEGSVSRVEEDRRSLDASVDWNLSDQWSFRGTLGAESYEIESRNVSSGVQTDPKGELSVSFRPRPRTTVSLGTTRSIGQLSFGQFLASSSLSSQILTAGASALEPHRSSSHSATYDQRFGDVGVLRFELSRNEIENPVQSVALSDSVVVAQNTFPRTVDQLRASVELPFERIGRGDLILEADARVAESETIDPVTGETRDVSGITSQYWSIGLRRDPGDGKIAWGVSMSDQTEGINYSVRRINNSSSSQEWDAYFEWEPIDGLKLRTNLDGPRTGTRRSLFFPSVRAPGLEPSFLSETTWSMEESASFSVEWRRRDNFEITGYIRTNPEVREEETLRPFGADFGPIRARRTVTTPQAQVRFRFYR